MLDERLKYFKVLGISPTDNPEALKKAYRKMAFRYHPDKNSSADAHFRFIQITEAYEILTGQRKPSNELQKQKAKTEEEHFAEKVAFAKARFRHQQEEEARKDAEYFRMITTGWKWKWFKAGAVFSAIISFMLTVDYFATGFTETISHHKASIIRFHHTISAKDEVFRVENPQYWQNDYYGQIRGNRSFLFSDLKSVSVVLNPEDMTIVKHSDRMKKLLGFDNFNLYTAMSINSMYAVFPVVHFFLLVPILLVAYKKPVLRFSIWRLVSIYILFPLALFILFSNDRLFHLLGLL